MISFKKRMDPKSISHLWTQVHTFVSMLSFSLLPENVVLLDELLMLLLSPASTRPAQSLAINGIFGEVDSWWFMLLPSRILTDWKVDSNLWWVTPFPLSVSLSLPLSPDLDSLWFLRPLETLLVVTRENSKMKKNKN